MGEVDSSHISLIIVPSRILYKERAVSLLGKLSNLIEHELVLDCKTCVHMKPVPAALLQLAQSFFLRVFQSPSSSPRELVVTQTSFEFTHAAYRAVTKQPRCLRGPLLSKKLSILVTVFADENGFIQSMVSERPKLDKMMCCTCLQASEEKVQQMLKETWELVEGYMWPDIGRKRKKEKRNKKKEGRMEVGMEMSMHEENVLKRKRRVKQIEEKGKKKKEKKEKEEGEEERKVDWIIKQELSTSSTENVVDNVYENGWNGDDGDFEESEGEGREDGRGEEGDEVMIEGLAVKREGRESILREIFERETEDEKTDDEWREREFADRSDDDSIEGKSTAGGEGAEDGVRRELPDLLTQQVESEEMMVWWEDWEGEGSREDQEGGREASGTMLCEGRRGEGEKETEDRRKGGGGDEEEERASLEDEIVLKEERENGMNCKKRGLEEVEEDEKEEEEDGEEMEADGEEVEEGVEEEVKEDQKVVEEVVVVLEDSEKKEGEESEEYKEGENNNEDESDCRKSRTGVVGWEVCTRWHKMRREKACFKGV